MTWIQYSNYDICPSNSVQDIRQNYWTMKYRSLTYIQFSVCVKLNQYLHYNINP